MSISTVLLVAPGASSARDIADELFLEGYIVFCAGSAVEAASLLKAGLAPSVVLVDARKTAREAEALATLTKGARVSRAPYVLVVGPAGGSQVDELATSHAFCPAEPRALMTLLRTLTAAS